MTVEELRAELKADRRRSWLRALLGPDKGGLAPIWFAQIIVGPRPEGWQPRTWSYSGCTFVTAEMSARGIAPFLVAGVAQELELGSSKGSFTPTDNAQWFHLASRQSYGNVELPWPSRKVTVALANGQPNAPTQYMVGTDAPSFPTFAGAYAAFFLDEWVQTGAGSPTLNQIEVRVVDGRARIQRVLARAASLDVWVGGRAVRGCRVELNTSTDRLETTVERSAKISFPLPTGLGQDPWIWLKDDNGWLDFRAVAGWGARQSPDVEFELPGDSVADISALASQGENTHLEYKRTLPDDDKESKRKVLKTVVAFANGDGGTVFFGVDGDDNVGHITGLDGKPAVLLRRLNDLIRDRVSPTPTVHVEGHDIEGKYVIRLDVEPGGGTLHALFMDPNRPEYYVRRNGSTYYARPEELAHIVGSRAQQPGQYLHRFP